MKVTDPRYSCPPNHTINLLFFLFPYKQIRTNVCIILKYFQWKFSASRVQLNNQSFYLFYLNFKSIVTNNVMSRFTKCNNGLNTLDVFVHFSARILSIHRSDLDKREHDKRLKCIIVRYHVVGKWKLNRCRFVYGRGGRTRLKVKTIVNMINMSEVFDWVMTNLSATSVSLIDNVLSNIQRT